VERCAGRASHSVCDPDGNNITFIGNFRVTYWHASAQRQPTQTEGELMATFVMIHGASADAHYWYRVTPLLEEAGHEVIAPDLPIGDDSADFDVFAATVVETVGDRRDVVVVAQSMGAFTGPVVATKVPTRLLVLLAPMIPAPGETPASGGITPASPRRCSTPKRRASTPRST